MGLGVALLLLDGAGHPVVKNNRNHLKTVHSVASHGQPQCAGRNGQVLIIQVEVVRGAWRSDQETAESILRQA